jgi:two-component system chemotaxis response regulator CheY
MKKVLICDDAAFMRMVITKIISSSGQYEIVGEAANGEEAVLKYKELRPDLVTMDITMPKKDGLWALKKIIAFDDNAKVVICSAMGQKPMVLEAIQAGAIDFLVKPFQKDRVFDTLKKCFY